MHAGRSREREPPNALLALRSRRAGRDEVPARRAAGRAGALDVRGTGQPRGPHRSAAEGAAALGWAARLRAEGRADRAARRRGSGAVGRAGGTACGRSARCDRVLPLLRRVQDARQQAGRVARGPPSGARRLAQRGEAAQGRLRGEGGRHARPHDRARAAPVPRSQGDRPRRAQRGCSRCGRFRGVTLPKETTATRMAVPRARARTALVRTASMLGCQRSAQARGGTTPTCGRFSTRGMMDAAPSLPLWQAAAGPELPRHRRPVAIHCRRAIARRQSSARGHVCTVPGTPS